MKRFDAILDWWFIQAIITIVFIVAVGAAAVIFEFTIGPKEAELMLWVCGLLLLIRTAWWWMNRSYFSLTS